MIVTLKRKFRCTPNSTLLQAYIGFKSNRNEIKEPPHDKTNKIIVRPAKIQISLGIRPVWSEALMGAQWVAKDQSIPHVDNEDSDQTGRVPRLIYVFAGCTCHFVGFVMRWLKVSLSCFVGKCIRDDFEIGWFCYEPKSPGNVKIQTVRTGNLHLP